MTKWDLVQGCKSCMQTLITNLFLTLEDISESLAKTKLTNKDH